MLSKVSLPMHPSGDLSTEERADWYRERNFVIRPVLVVTTVNTEGVPNAAVKTNFMTVSSMTRYAFACNPQHHTYRNILETEEFVINVPTEDIAAKVLKAALTTVNPPPLGVNEIERAGLTPIPSEKVKPPRIRECIAHYECVLEWHRDGVIFGKTVAASVDESLIRGKDERKMMLIGGGKPRNSYGVVGETKKWPRVSS